MSVASLVLRGIVLSFLPDLINLAVRIRFVNLRSLLRVFCNVFDTMETSGATCIIKGEGYTGFPGVLRFLSFDTGSPVVVDGL